MSFPNHHKLVLRVNELFHDLEGEDYEDVHPEIFEQEKRRWERLIADHLKPIQAHRMFVDLGAGTGFVGERLLPHMQEGDTFVCTDISSKMLTICSDKFSRLRPDIKMRTIKMNDEHIAIPDASADVVTMNSVLHHMPDVRQFLMECARVLKPTGLLYIGHEPNNRFFQKRPLLQVQASIFHQLVPKRIAARILKALGLYNSVIRTPKSDPVLNTINETLKAEGLTDHPLSRTDLSMLIDVHSPTAGGLLRDEGFDPLTLFDGLGTFRLRSVETYNHLSKPSGRHAWLRPYEKFLTMLFPHDGATFFLIAERLAESKPGQS